MMPVMLTFLHLNDAFWHGQRDNVQDLDQTLGEPIVAVLCVMLFYL